jgi:hypothetical protein
MSFSTGRLLSGILCAFGLVGISWGQQVLVTGEPVWRGVGTPRVVGVPVRLTFENRGEAVSGKVSAMTTGGVMAAPIRLEKGEKRKVEFYVPRPFGWGEKGFGVITPEVTATFQGQPDTKVLELDSSSQNSYGVISNRLRSLQVKPTSPSGRTEPAPDWPARTVIGPLGAFSEYWTRPGLAPKNPNGYLGFGFVLLGEGAEGVSNEEILALKDYVLMGGKLYFGGPGSAGALADPRWEGWLPLDSSTAVQSRGTGGPTELVEGVPRLEAVQDQVQGVTAWFLSRGLGFVCILGDDPWKKDAKGVPQGHGVISYLQYRLERAGHIELVPPNLRETSGGLTIERLSMGVRNSPGVGVSLSPPSTETEEAKEEEVDPFEMEAPPTGVIFGILAVYWIVLIPVHFGILSKLGKENAAWITGPLVALGFSFVFFGFSMGLLRSAESRTQEGVIAAQGGSSRGLFYGKQSVFFPKGGTRDLGLEGVHLAWESGYIPSSQGMVTSQFVSGPEVEAPAFSAPNLAVRSYALSQVVDLGKGFSAESTWRRVGGKWALMVKVKNGSKHTLRAPAVGLQKAAATLPNLAPGDEAEVALFPVSEFVQRGEPIPVWLKGFLENADIGARSIPLKEPHDRVMLLVNLGAVRPAELEGTAR